MDPAERGTFIAAYSRLVADVWAETEKDRLLGTDPRALLAEHGLRLPPDVRVEVVRDGDDTEPDLDVQVRAWEEAAQRKVFTLYVPSIEPVAEAELTEHELDNVVAGLDSSCACCCPCCCT